MVLLVVRYAVSASSSDGQVPVCQPVATGCCALGEAERQYQGPESLTMAKPKPFSHDVHYKMSLRWCILIAKSDAATVVVSACEPSAVHHNNPTATLEKVGGGLCNIRHMLTSPLGPSVSGCQKGEAAPLSC